MERATIYDYARMCKKTGACMNCLLGVANNGADMVCRDFVATCPNKANEIILDWCKGHPIETRQSKFLKMFPNVGLNLGVISICPCTIDASLYKGANEVECYRSKGYENCLQCYKDYWLAELTI